MKGKNFFHKNIVYPGRNKSGNASLNGSLPSFLFLPEKTISDNTRKLLAVKGGNSIFAGIF